MDWSDKTGWPDRLQRNLSHPLSDLQKEVSSLGQSIYRY